MKAEDIIRQLYAALPNYTDWFTDNFQVTSLTRAGTTVTAVIGAPHLLSTGDYAFILGAKNPIAITSLTQVNGVATAITSEDHDLTYDPVEIRYNREDKNIDISGANESDYNGTHKLLSVPNRRAFTYEIVDTAPATATGTPILLQEGIGYNGWFEVTVIDPVTFTYETEYAPNSPAEGTIETRLRPRISGAVTAQAAINAYTKQFEASPDRKLWGFVVVGDRVANKSREVMSDATTTPGVGAEYRQLVIQPFSIFCIFPATGSIAARKERDDADSLVLSFTKSLLRVRFPGDFSEDPFAGVTFFTDRFIEYNSAIYVHEYAFETTAWITYGDTVAPEHTTAFRNIDIDFESDLGETEDVIMTAKIDLDEEQLT